MRSLTTLSGLLLVIGTSIAAGQAPAPFPKDVYRESGNRFPALKREALNEAGKKLYDARGAVDAYGPGPMRLYSPSVAAPMTEVNEYLRRKSGLEPRLVELAILVTAREMDCAYVWTAHEPAAQKAGLPQAIIDAVKFRKPLTNAGDKETVIVQLGRDSLGKHKVSSDTFARAVKLFGNQGVVDIVSLIGDYAATTILANAADQHVRPTDKSLLPIP
ncbi:MAG TPA: carboxymuconolactone decarboxylase family protein [Vicinamibacterales bacterium]|jgi:4-carboxymuconolactone decarboxylase|nr:carboxymuconolactone decarboxylase family protein [Vicinamibacterales bacterium]